MTIDNKPETLITQDESLRGVLPKDFWYAAATAAYQIEGAWNEDGKGVGIWDELMNKPEWDATGNGMIACDSYHLWKEDIALIKSYGMNSYRFSISWSRVKPKGGADDEVNEKGIEYYNNLINGLLAEGITPWITIFHWDTPAELDHRYEGFADTEQIVRDFTSYANLLFERFGDRVKNWITYNEPLVYTGYNAQFFKRDVWTDALQAKYTRSAILCHAHAVNLYHKQFAPTQGGQIGIVLNIDWVTPIDDSHEARAAAQASNDFMLGQYADPIYLGFIPQTLIDRFGADHMYFTPEEWRVINEAGSDFFGLNHYSTAYATGKWLKPEEATVLQRAEGLQERVKEDKNGKVIGNRGQYGHPYDVPWGFRELLRHIHARYLRRSGLRLYITENGFAADQEFKMTREEACHGDANRQQQTYYANYIREVAQAVRDDGIDIGGYMCWSLLDNCEWTTGMVPRFGLTAVDFESPKRTRYPKDTVWMLRRVMDHLIKQ
ncbi:Beta-glucosidase 1B [Vanrija pseudolonga]|uniref:beta-glucosidase n=1 Tax=Vanrija pseudolonga TaxID=143232 RepID=A0AAF1BP98_9TREE|nr:Beta-glucosidase 1B [Vanrija pseudolonga]